MTTKNLLRKIIILFLLVTNAMTLFAQGGLPCDGSDPDATCPIDGPLLFMLVAVLAFTAWLKINQKRKRQAYVANR